MSVHASMCVGASLGAYVCLPILTEWKLPAWHGRPSLSAHMPQRAHPSPARFRAFRSVHASGAVRTTAKCTFLPSSIHCFLLESDTGAGLPKVVTRPLTRHPPRFAAMTFNTSGMIENWRIDVGSYAGLQVVGARPRLPAGGPAHGQGGQRLAAWAGSSWSFQHGTAVGLRRSWCQLRKDPGLPQLAEQAGQGTQGVGPTRGWGGQAACKGAQSPHCCSHRSAGCSGHRRHCCCQHCPAHPGQTPCPLCPPLWKERRGLGTAQHSGMPSTSGPFSVFWVQRRTKGV